MSLNFPLSIIGQQAEFSSAGLESGLVLTAEYAPETTFEGYHKEIDAVLACELLVPDNPAGLIWEIGAHGSGAYVGFRGDRALVIRAGDGSNERPETNDFDNMTLVRLTAGEVSGFGTLLVEFKVSTARIKVWWNGVLLAEEFSPNGAWLDGFWAGGNDGGYYQVGTGVTTGEVTSALPSSNRSDLRYYENQLISS